MIAIAKTGTIRPGKSKKQYLKEKIYLGIVMIVLSGITGYFSLEVARFF